MSQNVFAVLEPVDGKIGAAGLELLCAAKDLAGGLGGEAQAVILGKDVAEAAAFASKYGVAKVLVADHEALDPYQTSSWLQALSGLIGERTPGVVLMTHTPVARDLAARLAIRVDGALVTDCTSLKIESANLVAERPVYAGKLLAFMELSGKGAKIVTVRPKSFDKAEEGGEAPVESFSPSIEADARVVVKEVVKKASGAVPLTEADVVVSAGRGIKAPENFAMIEELAEVLGAAVGASRAVVDAGWRDHASQVGQTGKVVRPNLYIATGISGAIQHLAGMQNSKFILAINKDAEAPIFKKADFGIVGDMFEVVPELTKAFKEALGK
jgi:electron transfer flavoprotein alpha subunit